MYQNDYILRQIEMMARFFIRLLRKEAVVEAAEDFAHVPASGGSILEMQLLSMVREEQINEAENLLFEKIEEHPTADYLQAAISFYKALLRLNPAQLAAAHFSEEEIMDGLYDLKRLYQIPDLIELDDEG